MLPGATVWTTTFFSRPSRTNIVNNYGDKNRTKKIEQMTGRG